MVAPPAPAKPIASISAQRNASAVTEVVAPKIVTPAPTRRPVRPARSETQLGFFSLSSHFILDGAGSWFIPLGILCNVGSAVLIGKLWSNFSFLLAGSLFSVLMFILSVFFVDRILATFCAVLVAFYWLVVGWSVGRFLVALLHLNPLFAPPFTAFVFFGISVFLNVWYVARKNL